MLVSILAVLCIAYCGLGLILYFMQSSFLYRSSREVAYTPGDLGLAFESVVFQTQDGVKMTGWYIPAKNADLTILFCHGNAGNMMHGLDSINLFHEWGANCLIFDYRGYGRSQGKASEEGTYIDAETAYEWLRTKKKTGAEKIIIFGRSLGGSIAAHLAAKVKPRGLVIESSFTSYADIGQKFYPYMPVRWFALFSYKTIDYIREVYCPVLIVHSRNDEVVPFEFGLRLYEAANEPKELLEIFGTHNDGFLYSGVIYSKQLTSWLDFVKKYHVKKEPMFRRIS